MSASFSWGTDPGLQRLQGLHEDGDPSPQGPRDSDGKIAQTINSEVRCNVAPGVTRE